MIDTKSETWETLIAFIDNELAITSRKLTVKLSSLDDTMFNRGLYAAFEQIKNLPNRDPVKPVEINSYFD